MRFRFDPALRNSCSILTIVGMVLQMALSLYRLSGGRYRFSPLWNADGGVRTSVDGILNEKAYIAARTEAQLHVMVSLTYVPMNSQRQARR